MQCSYVEEKHSQTQSCGYVETYPKWKWTNKSWWSSGTCANEQWRKESWSPAPGLPVHGVSYAHCGVLLVVRLVPCLVSNASYAGSSVRKKQNQVIVNLPEEQLSTSPWSSGPFSCISLDVFGPFTACRTRGGHANNKRCAMLFSCTSTWTVYIDILEMMDNLSSINALWRFFDI